MTIATVTVCDAIRANISHLPKGAPAAGYTTGTIGPSLICGACADKLLAVIWGSRWPAMKAHLDGLGRVAHPGAEVPVSGKKARRRLGWAQDPRPGSVPGAGRTGRPGHDPARIRVPAARLRCPHPRP